MNELVFISGGNAVTTTWAIAEGTDNEHASVIKLVRTYENDLAEFGGVRFEIQSFQTAGGAQQREIAYLNEQQSTLLLTYMRNSEVVRSFKKRLIKKFWEMAEQLRGSQVKFHIPQSLSEALRLAADLADQNKTLEHKVNQDAPKVDAYERLCHAEGSLCLMDAAKTLQIRPYVFTAWLQSIGWIHKRVGKKNWLGYQPKIAAGYILHKSTSYVDAKDGVEKISDQVRITGKGLTRLAQMRNEDSSPQSEAA